ncbi:MAG TPA: acyl-CoA dehydrogenase [Pseudomonas xinjiangensis]|uniref:Acyl-CoA dehydrogenase n=2 Tax=root TaxID=1 RepID=A0A7V1BLY8_9GAMM|nr:acyl-CoA dehydrogenase [Halopseudomonas xinjiangensis]HEC47562.1 acyl-CoA dehydrogenase [Halopseudomonas xinjiangensis]
MLEQNVEELAAIREQARRVLEDCANPEHLKQLLGKPGSFDRSLWNKAAELGWPALAASEEAGGLGLGWRGLSVLSEETGRLTASIPLTANALTVHALVSTGDNQHQNLVEQLIAGEKIACLAPAAQADGSLSATTSFSGGPVRLTGHKAMTAFAAVADLALIPTGTGSEASLYLVDLTDPGVHRETFASIDNARAAAELHLDQATAIALGGAALVREITRLAAVAHAFEQVAGAQACLEMACAYALERKAFGQPIGHFQGIKHKLAESYCLIEIARGCAFSALSAVESQAADQDAQACAARLAAIKAYEYAAQENLHVHGGMGVTWEAMPHHHYRRSRCLALELGASNHWSNRLLSAIADPPDQPHAEHSK